MHIVGSTGVQMDFCRSLGSTKPTQSTGVQTLCVGSTGVKEIRGAHMSYIFLARIPWLFLCSPFTPPPDSNRHAAFVVPRRRRRRPLHLPSARAIATARHPHRRAPSPQRIQRRPRAPPTYAARARLHRHAPPCVSAPPPRAQSRSSHTSSSPHSRASTPSTPQLQPLHAH